MNMHNVFAMYIKHIHVYIYIYTSTPGSMDEGEFSGLNDSLNIYTRINCIFFINN